MIALSIPGSYVFITPTCYENGLPQPDETQSLNRIEDWLDEKGKTFPIWLVGVVTQQGWRDFVFMSEEDS
ncbi:Cytoplasmic protein [Salmonella enterica subsp. enterica]|uniref:Cytoplasmic protein n=1 Tax=Salmonella enterica I TaxID=59201 RepID=A0A3S4LU02_SALET|nr:Cytoplasmic protein [Salmonella enterica subsp. enterica]